MSREELRVVSRAGPTEGKNALMAARWGTLPRQDKSHVCTSFPARETVTSMRNNRHTDRGVHSRAGAQLGRMWPKRARAPVTLRCHWHQRVPLAQTATCSVAEGDFTASHMFPAGTLVSQPGRWIRAGVQLKTNPEGKQRLLFRLRLPGSAGHQSPLVPVTLQGRLGTSAAGPALSLLMTV